MDKPVKEIKIDEVVQADIEKAIQEFINDRFNYTAVIMVALQKDGSQKIVSSPLYLRDRCMLAMHVMAWAQSYLLDFTHYEE